MLAMLAMLALGMFFRFKRGRMRKLNGRRFVGQKRPFQVIAFHHHMEMLTRSRSLARTLSMSNERISRSSKTDPARHRENANVRSAALKSWFNFVVVDMERFQERCGESKQPLGKDLRERFFAVALLIQSQTDRRCTSNARYRIRNPSHGRLTGPLANRIKVAPWTHIN